MRSSQSSTFPFLFRQVRHFNIPVEPKWLFPPRLTPLLELVICYIARVARAMMQCRYLACSELSSDSFEPSRERSLEMGSISTLLWNQSVDAIPPTKTFLT